MNKQFSGIRNDIGHFTLDVLISNVCRIFKMKNIEYEYINEEIKIGENILSFNLKDIGGLFKKNVYILIKNKISESDAQLIEEYRKAYGDLIIISDDSYYIKEDIIHYNELENEYKPLIPLWEDKLQNISNKPDLYVKDWVIGKRELKRKHPKFFPVGNKNLKTGQLWKRPSQVGYHGRPWDENGGFLDTFEIRDADNNIFEKNTNWGAILSRIGQIIKDNPYRYYNTNERLSIFGHSKKMDKWIEMVQYDAIKNYWIYIPKKKKV